MSRVFEEHGGRVARSSKIARPGGPNRALEDGVQDDMLSKPPKLKGGGSSLLDPATRGGRLRHARRSAPPRIAEGRATR